MLKTTLLAATLVLWSPAASAPPRQSVLELEKTLTVGCADCNGPEQLGEVRSVGVDAAGRIYVLSTFAPFVRIFEADGSTAGTAGPDGDGPGELRRPAWIHVADSGEFFAHGSRLNRLVRFAPDGSATGTFDISPRSVSDAAFDPVRGQLYLAVYVPTGEPPSIVRWDPAADSVETVASGPEAFPTENGRSTPIFSLAVAADGGFATGDGHGYVLRRYDASGRLVATFGRELGDVHKSAEEIAAERREIEQRGLPVSRVDESKPHFGIAALEFDDDGRLWVRTTRGGVDETIFDLFAPTGDYLGEVLLPARAANRHFVVRNHRLTVITLDDLDDPYATVWRVLER